MMVSCSLDTIEALRKERDNWACMAAQLQAEVLYLQQKVMIAEELVRAVRELQEAAAGALAVGERS